MSKDSFVEELQSDATLTQRAGQAGLWSFFSLVGSGVCMWQLHLGWYGIGAIFLLSLSCSFAAQIHTLTFARTIFKMLFALGRLIEE